MVEHFADCRLCEQRIQATNPAVMSRFITCPTCGNKRCPKASAHFLLCTGSNESGQPGSFYGPPEYWPK